MPRKWFISGSLLLMAAPIVALVLPYAVSAYHLEVGGQALEEALGEIDALNWWYVGPVAVQDSPTLQGAIAHLEKATQYTHALRLLGRAHAARGDLLSSIEALKQFTAQRPENAMGHLELAAAYERAKQRLQEMYSASLLEALPGAAVSAPDLPGETHYQPEGWHSEYAYPTAFLLSPDEGERPTLFLHAGSQVTYTLTLTQPAVLSFAMGLDPRSLGWGGDGVTFEVLVDGARVFLEHLPAEVARNGWQERQVDLAAYAGQTIALSLASTPGPVGDVTADWAGWGDPRVEVREAVAYREVVRDEPWRSEWAVAGVTARDFVNAGEQVRRAQRYEGALEWYAWAAEMEPELSDVWYYCGLVWEELDQVDEALSAYRRAIEQDSFSLNAVELGDAYGALGRVLIQRGSADEGRSYLRLALQAGMSDPLAYFDAGGLLMEKGLYGDAYAVYEALVGLPQLKPTASDRHLLDLRHETIVALSTAASRMGDSEATIRWASEAKQDYPLDIRPYVSVIASLFDHGLTASAAEECSSALEIRSDVPSVDYYCGMVYRQLGRYEVAVVLLQDVARLEPDNVEAHLALADLYRELGRINEAIAEFEEVVRLAPDHSYALIRLEELHDR